MDNWEHTELGLFAFQSYGRWLGTVRLPLFRKFIYRPCRSNEPSDFIPLSFGSYEEATQKPSEEAIRVAIAAVANHAQLIEDGLRILHDDFSGRGPHPGMWWTDSLHHLQDILGDKYPEDILQSPTGLYQLLGDPSIDVGEFGYAFNRPCAIIGFESPLDVEHGIGLLTDGRQIIGCGYRSDASAFPEFATNILY